MGWIYAMTLKAFLGFVAFPVGLLTSPSFAADKYVIDHEHVYIQFSIQHHPWAKYLGAFHDINGTILFDRDNVSASSVQAVIAAGSIDTSNKDRDIELQAYGFLEGWQFPNITYESTSVQKTSDNMGKVDGNLTMAGITVPVTLEVTFNGEAVSQFDGKPRVGFSATGKLSTDDFKMVGLPNLHIGPEVNFQIEVEAPKQ
jgi:polyisoprenoid-binding protein YceI